MLAVFLALLASFAALDIFMVASLVKSGDERSRLIVLKASALTLLCLLGSNIFKIAESFANKQSVAVNPFIQLQATAITYFVLVMFYKKKYGG